ncbi:uncharacterized protein SCHCODRAFT_02719337, partial [Schizophyllum commune H4-8]|uniref:uncharacterized protein n=1 Tax=Schizophyllum commune (strain H4-8 / FGSC 9210) TaxID=578458 RepID=UPI00215F8AE8
YTPGITFHRTTLAYELHRLPDVSPISRFRIRASSTLALNANATHKSPAIAFATRPFCDDRAELTRTLLLYRHPHDGSQRARLLRMPRESMPSQVHRRCDAWHTAANDAGIPTNERPEPREQDTEDARGRIRACLAGVRKEGEGAPVVVGMLEVENGEPLKEGEGRKERTLRLSHSHSNMPRREDRLEQSRKADFTSLNLTSLRTSEKNDE